LVGSHNPINGIPLGSVRLITIVDQYKENRRVFTLPSTRQYLEA